MFGIGDDWLRRPVSEWDSDPNYKEAETHVRQVKVVNDLQEKAVKIIPETSVTNAEIQKQFILQVVDYHLKLISNFQK